MQITQLRSQQGFSVIEALFATLLFSITVLGLMRYHQTLMQQFYYRWYQQTAWLKANDALVLYVASGDESGRDERWKTNLTVEHREEGCQSIKATVQPPIGKAVTLVRWWCRASHG